MGLGSMRNALVEKNWINLIGALSLAILPLLVSLSQPAGPISSKNTIHSIELAELSTD